VGVVVTDCSPPVVVADGHTNEDVEPCHQQHLTAESWVGSAAIIISKIIA
jgi:hypothetical protein